MAIIPVQLGFEQLSCLSIVLSCLYERQGSGHRHQHCHHSYRMEVALPRQGRTDRAGSRSWKEDMGCPVAAAVQRTVDMEGDQSQRLRPRAGAPVSL